MTGESTGGTEYERLAGYFVGSVTIVACFFSGVSGFVAVPTALFFALLTERALQPDTDRKEGGQL